MGSEWAVKLGPVVRPHLDKTLLRSRVLLGAMRCKAVRCSAMRSRAMLCDACIGHTLFSLLGRYNM
jgi:hypothetical protein